MPSPVNQNVENQVVHLSLRAGPRLFMSVALREFCTFSNLTKPYILQLEITLHVPQILCSYLCKCKAMFDITLKPVNITIGLLQSTLT
jgi:hypothetical protein